jgi:GNAT superfamily N-acetyltransferase
LGSCPGPGLIRTHAATGRPIARTALLARLGVDTEHEGRGLGAGLLQDVFARLLGLSGEVGCRGLLVHAESTEARDFYLHLVPEFESSPTDDLHLLLLMNDIRRTVDGGYGTAHTTI